jgi:mannose-6-phosphate isomerase-like protein (cupin superfamily)
MRQADFASRGDGQTPFKGGRFKLVPGSTSKLDIHDDRECWMVVSGNGMLSYNGQQLRVEGGDFLYFEPNKSHQIHNDQDEDLLINTIWWD